MAKVEKLKKNKNAKLKQKKNILNNKINNLKQMQNKFTRK